MRCHRFSPHPVPLPQGEREPKNGLFIQMQTAVSWSYCLLRQVVRPHWRTSSSRSKKETAVEWRLGCAPASIPYTEKDYGNNLQQRTTDAEFSHAVRDPMDADASRRD